jgi:hypothetical protein
MATRHRSPWARRLPEGAHISGANAAVFMAFVAAGCGYIVLAKLAGVGQFYVTFAPVATMLAYALLIYLARGLRLRDDQSGDNLYYMGFLFTLTSLGVSLYQFTATRAADEIVQNFGIAIASTIAGIGLRVLFNQMRRDPVEVERMMRLELAEAARRVRRELDSSVVEFAHYRRTAQQAATDSFNHATEKFDEIVAGFLGRLEELTAKLAAPLEAASRRSADAIAEASQGIGTRIAENAGRLSAASEALSERVTTISAALGDMVTKLASLQTPDRVIEVKLEPMVQSITQAADGLAAQAQAQAARMEAALKAANEATQRSLDLITALRQESDTAAATSRAGLEAATNMIEAMAAVLDEFKTSSKSHLEVLRFMLEQTDTTMRTFTDVLIKSGIEAAARTDGLREVLPAIEASTHVLAAAGERISGLVQDLGSTRRRPQRQAVD